MICYVLAMGKQHLGPRVVVGYGIKIFWPGLFITSSDHLVIPPNSKIETRLRRNSFIDASWLTNLLQFQGESSTSCCSTRELVSIDPRHMTCYPPIGIHI